MSFFVDNYQDERTVHILDAHMESDTGKMIHDGGQAYDVFVSGSYAYVADWNDGLEIINISDPTDPVKVGQFTDGGEAVGVYVSGEYAYLADGWDGLEILKISESFNSSISGYNMIFLLSAMVGISIIIVVNKLYRNRKG